jgi:hypothetical protein
MPSGHGAPGKSPSESGGHVQSAHIELFTPSRWSLFRQAGVRARVVPIGEGFCGCWVRNIVNDRSTMRRILAVYRRDLTRRAKE